MHVDQKHQYPFLTDEIHLMRRMVHEGAPVWGICLGAQLLATAAGGAAYKRKRPEVGWTSIEKVADDPLLRGISSPFVAFNWHAYSCKISPTSHLVATCGDGVQVFRAGGRAWATQFHPEVDAEMAPHWVRDAVKEQKHLGPAFAEQLQRETDERLAGVPGVLPARHRELPRRLRPALEAAAPCLGDRAPNDPVRTRRRRGAPPRAPVSWQPPGEGGL